MKFLYALMPVAAVIAGLVLVLGAGDVSGESRPVQVYGGMPLATRHESEFKFIDNESFDIGYSDFRQDPVWVGYFVGPRRLPGKFKRPATFRTDGRTSSRVSHRDYSRSGFDRGHMAPNHAIATRYGADGQAETFLMSNVVPQRPALNRQVWRRIEELEADHWAADLDGLWVITGPIFDDDRHFLKKRQPRIDVPDAFFKVVVDEFPAAGQGSSRPRVLAFVVPQDVKGDESIAEFLVSVDSIEMMAGLDLMPDLDDRIESVIESEVADAIW